MLTLGKSIKELRMAAGLTQRQFAEVLQIDSSYLSHLEADRREPSVSLLKKMAAALDVPPGLLLAVALWAELPDEDRTIYEGLIKEVFDLAKHMQYRLEFE